MRREDLRTLSFRRASEARQEESAFVGNHNRTKPHPAHSPEIFHVSLPSASIQKWQPRNKPRFAELARHRLAAAKRPPPRRRRCESFTPASKRPSLALRNRSASPRRSLTPSAKPWRPSRSGRHVTPAAAPTTSPRSRGEAALSCADGDRTR